LCACVPPVCVPYSPVVMQGYQVMPENTAPPVVNTSPRKGPNRGEALEELDQRRSKLVMTIVWLGLLGWVLAVIENEMLWNNGNRRSASIEFIKFITFGSTCALLYIIYTAYTVEFEMLEISGKTVTGATFFQAFSMSSLMFPFVRDIFLCAFTPVPFFDGNISVWGMGQSYPYSADAFMTLLMIARVWTITPLYFSESSGYRNEKTRLVGLLNNVKVDNKFIMKHLLNNSLPVLASTFGVFVFTLAYSMVVAERPEGPNTNLADFENSIWVIIITMTTVGYGDTYPKTPLGRTVAVIASLLAIVLVALTVNAVTERLSLTRDESKVLEFIEDVDARRDRRAAGAHVVAHGWRAYKQLRQSSGSRPPSGDDSRLQKRICFSPYFSQACLKYNKLRSLPRGISTDLPLITTETMVGVKSLQSKVDAMETRVAEMHGLVKSAVPPRPRTMSTM